MIIDKTLVVAAHPDDDVLGCGGLIARLTNQGKNVRVIFIAEGSSCRFNNIIDAEEEIIFRNKCAVKALSVLGVDNYKFYNLPCGRLDQEPIIDIAKIIEKEICYYSPDTLLTHYYDDLNNDHKICAIASIQATRPVNNIVKNLLSFEVPSATDWRFTNAFEPNFFVDISKIIDTKILAMNEYTSEQPKSPHPRSDDNIRSLAMVRGGQSGVVYAESFKLIRSFY